MTDFISTFKNSNSFRPKGVTTSLTSGTGTFIPSADGMWYRGVAVGPGGNGGAGDTTNGGGGGGYGEVVEFLIKVPIAGIAYVVGAPGGTTVFGQVFARGAAAGSDRSTNGGRGGFGGGATSDSTSTTPYVIRPGSTPGGAGGCGNAFATYPGAPALPEGFPFPSPAVTNGLSGLTNTAANAGGTGASGRFGNGGVGGGNDAVGSNATGYGAGGGGGGKAASGTRAGGTGTGGYIYLEPLGVW